MTRRFAFTFLAVLWLGACTAEGRNRYEQPVVAAGYSFGLCSGACRADLTILVGGEVWLIVRDSGDAPIVADNAGALTATGRASLVAASESLADTILEEAYGCPDCEDRGAAFVELRGDRDTQIHSYDWGNPPAELGAVDAVLTEVILALQDCRESALVALDADCEPAVPGPAVPTSP